MTKKHYIAIAEAISNLSRNPGNSYEMGYEAARFDIANALLPVFKTDNTNFDSQRFLLACKLNG